ncbi:TPA: hypothetical protein DCX16_01970 [bacterium]|nr:hypothetical protein [bacterium]
MKEKIELLKALQERDTLIKEKEETIVEIPKIIQEEEEKIKDLNKEIEEKKAYFEELKKKLRHNERELSIYEDKIKGFKSRIYEIKTKKELDTLDSEVAKLEKQKGQLEEESLLLMDEIDNEERILNEKIKEKEIKEQDFIKKRDELELKFKEAKISLDTALKEKTDIASHLEQNILNLYETIRKNKNNIVLARIEGNICGVCQMSLRPQAINEVKECQEIIRCESCLRILYI